MVCVLAVGQSHCMKAEITANDVERFIELSGDRAAIHTDAEFARRSGFDGPLIHGAHLVVLLSRMIGMEFPGEAAVLQRLDLAFRQPCYAPCKLLLTATVKQVSEAVASAIIDVEIADDTGRILATGKTWHRILEMPTR